MSEQDLTLTRCPAKDPGGQRCRLYRGHDGQHGDGLGAVWDRDYNLRDDTSTRLARLRELSAAPMRERPKYVDPTTPAPRLGGEREGEVSVCWACGQLVQHNTGHKCEAFDD